MWEGETCIFIVTVWANVSGGAPLTMIILTLNLSLATKVKMRFRGIVRAIVVMYVCFAFIYSNISSKLKLYPFLPSTLNLFPLRHESGNVLQDDNGLKV